MTVAIAETPRLYPARRRTDWFKYALVAPAIFILLVVGLFPFLYSIMISFQRLTLLSKNTDWAGFVNYARIFGDTRLWNALIHTGIITVIALPLQLVLGLLMAQHFLEERRGKRIFIALLIIPSVISPIVAGSMWRLMLDDRYGPVNQIIGGILGEHLTILWTIKPLLAFVAIIVADVWEWTPFMFVVLLAALANVNRDQLDAASIDGATAWKTFRYITLPAIWPVLVIALLIRGLDLVRIFDIVWQLTKGGPGTATETASIYLFIKSFQEFDTSYAGALVVLLIILLSALVVAVLRRVEIAR